MGMVVRKEIDSREKEAVFRFMKTHMRPEINVWFANSIPVVADLPRDGKNPISGEVRTFFTEPKYAAYFKQLENVMTSALLHPAGPKIAQESNLIMQTLILNPDQDIHEVLAEADKTLNGYLND